MGVSTLGVRHNLLFVHPVSSIIVTKDNYNVDFILKTNYTQMESTVMTYSKGVVILFSFLTLIIQFWMIASSSRASCT